MAEKKVIGLDIGGTHISAVVLNANNRIIKKAVINTPKTENAFIKVLRTLVFNLDRKTKDIGIGTAGVIHGTTLNKGPNIHSLKKFDFLKVFPKPFKISVDNDARVFLRSEWIAGKINKNGKVMGFTIGTGIGRAFGQRGKIIKIKNLEYPEKWEKEFQLIRDSENTLKLAVYLARKLSVIIKRYNPQTVILGGGVVIGRKQKFLVPFKKELRNIGIKSEIKKTKLGSIAGAVGSALLVK